MRNQRAALGNSVNQQRSLTDGDRFAASLGVARGVLHGGLDQGSCCTLAEITSGQVGGQHKIEVICAVFVCFSLGGCRFEDVDIHARYLDGCLCVIDWLTEEVVGAYRA